MKLVIDTPFTQKAYRIAEHGHSGQTRRTFINRIEVDHATPYIEHPLGVGEFAVQQLLQWGTPAGMDRTDFNWMCEIIYGMCIVHDVSEPDAANVVPVRDVLDQLKMYVQGNPFWYGFEDNPKMGMIHNLPLLTKADNASYGEYISMMKGYTLAIHCKLSDLTHNMFTLPLGPKMDKYQLATLLLKSYL